MDNLIVTLTNPQKSFFYDVEIPSSLSVEKLKGDIVEALVAYDSNIMLKNENCILFCNRLNRQLDNAETPLSAGVWNGDYITVMEA